MKKYILTTLIVATCSCYATEFNGFDMDVVTSMQNNNLYLVAKVDFDTSSNGISVTTWTGISKQNDLKTPFMLFSKSNEENHIIQMISAAKGTTLGSSGQRSFIMDYIPDCKNNKIKIFNATLYSDYFGKGTKDVQISSPTGWTKADKTSGYQSMLSMACKGYPSIVPYLVPTLNLKK